MQPSFSHELARVEDEPYIDSMMSLSVRVRGDVGKILYDETVHAFGVKEERNDMETFD